MADMYGTDAYNRAFGLDPLKYAKGNANGQVDKPNTIGTLTGNTLLPTLTAFNMGIDPSQVYKNAGLASAEGSYTGLNNSWNPAGGASDTYAARDQRIAALKSAGMSDSDARIEADNGFQIAESDADRESRLAAEYFQQTGRVYQPQQQQQVAPQLQPFQQTQQYQNYLAQSFSQPQTQNFQQPRQQLQTFQTQSNMPQSGGLLSYNQPQQPQFNQYGLLNPYATSQR